VALSCTINYHSSPDTGEILYVEGIKIDQSRKIGTFMFELFSSSDLKKKKVATMISTLYRTGKPIE